MKRLQLLAAIAACALPLSTFAAIDADAAAKLAKDQGCTKCHAIDKTKKGPSYQKVAAKYKGKGEGEAKVTDVLVKPRKVKLEDGTEEEHKVLDKMDPAQLKNLVGWILAQ